MLWADESDLSGLRLVSVDEFCADGDEFASLIKNRDFFEYPNKCQPVCGAVCEKLREDTTPYFCRELSVVVNLTWRR
jgi:hypothetical protein